MGKITLTALHSDTKIEFPKELIFLFKESKSRRIRISLFYSSPDKTLQLLITDGDWSDINSITCAHENAHFIERRKSNIIINRCEYIYIRNSNNSFSDDLNNISFIVSKPKGYTVCEKIELDYTVYQNSQGKFLITSAICLNNLSINRNYSIVRRGKNELHGEIKKIMPNISTYHFNKAIDNLNEIYYYKHTLENNIVYLTKDKYAYACFNSINLDTISLNRTMSIGKFFKDYFPEIPEANINAYIEYNKMLTSYDSSLLSIVSGDDIIKYYLESSYFRMTGELGSSCMRDSSKSYVIKFYANNSNFKLLIMKAGKTDTIMARALLVTTTDGTVFMDRVYTVNTKLIKLFHRYAKENDIENIYEYREWDGCEKNLCNQSPGNWTKKYDENYTVDLDWLPDEITKTTKALRYIASIHQNSSITNGYNLPYIDNFQYVNAFTRQASVNALNFFTTCDLSDELIDNSHVYCHDNKVYDKRFVEINAYGNPNLKIDIVTLDSPNTPQSSNNGVNEADEDGEDFNWDDDDLDNDDLESEQEVARIVANFSELIATDSQQQEQHIAF